jgi:hypothetical protein
MRYCKSTLEATIYILVCSSDMNVDFLLLSFKFHTTKESLRRHRHGQVLSDHPGQALKLLLVLIPPHVRVCVVGHLMYGCVLTGQSSSVYSLIILWFPFGGFKFQV